MANSIGMDVDTIIGIPHSLIALLIAVSPLSPGPRFYPISYGSSDTICVIRQKVRHTKIC